MRFRDADLERQWHARRLFADHAAVFAFAAAWADRVEVAIAEGAALHLSLVLRLSSEVDPAGVSSLQFQLASNLLSRVWFHGDVFFEEHDFGD